jgi:phenylalanyl-tRNA synthetase alpha chain
VSEITPQSVETAITAALSAISEAQDSAALKVVRAAYTAEGSLLAKLNASMREVPADQKAEAGKLVGEARARVNAALAEAEARILAVEERAQFAAETIDVTAVPSRRRTGARHPLSVLMEQMGDIFVAMGWEVAEGPELEHAWFNFDALNIDPDHPARGEQDTFYIEPADRNLVLRSQTSNVQIRSLLDRPLPLYVVAPGKVFRKDELDATHTPVFHQIEGIAIDRGLTMAHLRGTLEHLARAMFGEGAQIRLRPNYFPFTEPSAEMDVWQPNAKGGARWVEWGGCGMVNPNVLRSAGVDPAQYQGFAFGMGIERTLQFRNDMNDMRDMVEGDVRFSQQFGMVV